MLLKNPEAIYHVHVHVIPAALALLPAQMSSPEAHAMLLAIGLQESDFVFRQQLGGGPAHGYWQFEKAGGVRGVIKMPQLKPVLHILNYAADEAGLYVAMIHNDVLACAMARLLLWTVPGSLATRGEPEKGWQQYISAWRPGKPRHAAWPDYFEEAWRHVIEEV